MAKTWKQYKLGTLLLLNSNTTSFKIVILNQKPEINLIWYGEFPGDSIVVMR